MPRTIKLGNRTMPRTITPGTQSFAKLRQNNYFYIDKTKFIKEWWNDGIDVTLITRPRRFGKTLMLDTVNTFFSLEYAGRSDLFEGLEIWKDEEFRNLQGTIPVIFLSFADVKSEVYSKSMELIKDIIVSTYDIFKPNFDLSLFTDTEKEHLASVNRSMSDATAQTSLRHLARYVERQYNNAPIILLDEYDSPLHEAWFYKYLDKQIEFLRGFFNSTFKTNKYIKRALITGITRIAKESIFSDMNNLEVITTTSVSYSDYFGFTEQEVFSAMDEYGLTQKKKVKRWYDGFIFGKNKAIYNPWSIINYLQKKEFFAYWAKSSSNKIVGELILQSNEDVREDTSELLKGKSIKTMMEEEFSFSQLDEPGVLWSFLMATGYLKPISFNKEKQQYKLTLTNHEVHLALDILISNWFKNSISYNRKFLKALLSDDLEGMNINLNHITKTVFSFFDTSGNEPERFYHGFVLGLIVDMKDRYIIKSNRESGSGRYDVTMFPKRVNDKGIVIEFKTLNYENEINIEKTCKNALKQIRKKDYIKELLDNEVISSKIYVYGFGFHGKDVMICGGANDQIDWIDIMKEK